MWLFHFRSGGEQQTNNATNAEGIGHAIRCLRIKKTAEDKFGIKTCVITSDNFVSRDLIKNRGIEAFFDESLLFDESFMRDFEVVISDINYLDASYFKLYSKFSISVCLAPRGVGKFLADISFKDSSFNDIQDIYDSNVYNGLKYVVTGNRYRNARKKIDTFQLIRSEDNIIISMGGLDQFDMTSSAVLGLIGCPKEWNIKIIIGPQYPHIKKLTQKIKELNCTVEILKDPPDLYDLMASSSYGIFGSGIVSFEGVGLGLICFNLSQSEFHKHRAEEMEQFDAGFYVGDASIIKEGEIFKMIKRTLKSRRIDDIRKKGMSLVDSDGARRIINKIINFQNDSKK